MHTLYSLASGPLVYVAFAVLILGTIWKLYSLAMLAKKKDQVFYEYWDNTYAFRSIMHWSIPFGSTNWRLNPVLTVVTFVFHICLIITPIFLAAHVIMIKEAFDIAWPTLPNPVADTMTLIVILCCGYFLGRRMFKPDTKYLTSAGDYYVLLMVALPFITGYWAYNQWPFADVMTILHMVTGAFMLIAIPFTRLSHAIYAILIRGYTGSEFGAVRHARDW